MLRRILFVAAIVGPFASIDSIHAQPTKTSKPAAKPVLPAGTKAPAAKKFTEDQLSSFFFGAAYGKLEALNTGIETHGIPANYRNSSYATALHLVYANFPKDIIRESDQILLFRECVDYLIRKGASPLAKTADSLNCLQLAVKSGRWPGVQSAYERDRNYQIRDRQGNSLLHLATQHYFDYTKDKTYMDGILKMCYKIDINTQNNAGQNPLVYFLSTSKKSSEYATAIVNTLLDYNCNPLLRDSLGKNAYDYITTQNAWLKPWMDQYDQAEAARKKMFKEMEETWKRQTAENLARYEAWKRSGGDGGDGQRLLTASFTITYGFSCSLTKDAKTGKPYMKSRALQEPVTVEVTPSSIYISSLEPYYGSFKIASSGYEIIEGAEAEVYYFEQTGSNSTYKGIAFRKDNRHQRAMLKTSSGFEQMCN
jgi:hypothetical protein